MILLGLVKLIIIFNHLNIFFDHLGVIIESFIPILRFPPFFVCFYSFKFARIENAYNYLKNNCLMKHFNKLIGILSAFTILFSLPMVAQDVLITKGGDVHTVYGVEVGNTAVFYKLENAANAPIQRMDKGEIFMIKHPDGSKLTFNDSPEASEQQKNVAITQDVTMASNRINEQAKARNEELIRKLNSGKVTFVNEKKRGKDAARLFCMLGVKEDSQFCNDEVELSYVMGHYDFDYTSKIMTFVSGIEPLYGNQALQMIVKNKTKKTIYLDLGNTFFMRGSEASVYYVPTATSSTSSSSTGGSVNVGSVASALGIGGAVGTIANGVNVGGGKSNATTNITYSQRVVAIPPMSSKALDGQLLFPKDSKQCSGITVYHQNKYIDIPAFFLGRKEEVAAGQSFKYIESNSPIKFSTYVTYSFSEDCVTPTNIAVSFYLKEAISFTKASGGSADWSGSINKDLDGWKNVIGFIGYVAPTGLKSILFSENGIFPHK